MTSAIGATWDTKWKLIEETIQEKRAVVMKVDAIGTGRQPGL